MGEAISGFSSPAADNCILLLLLHQAPPLSGKLRQTCRVVPCLQSGPKAHSFFTTRALLPQNYVKQAGSMIQQAGQRSDNAWTKGTFTWSRGGILMFRSRGKFGRGWHTHGRHNHHSGRRAERQPGHWPCRRKVAAAANVRLCQSAQCAMHIQSVKVQEQAPLQQG